MKKNILQDLIMRSNANASGMRKRKRNRKNIIQNLIMKSNVNAMKKRKR